MDVNRGFSVSEAFAKSFANLSQETDLHEASRQGNYSSIEGILGCGDGDSCSGDATDQDEPPRDVNERNHLGCTPLWLACAGGHTLAARLLLDNGAAMETEDIKGQTPLHAACKLNRAASVELLLRRGADPDGSAMSVRTPIHDAARHNFHRVVRMLVRFGADVNGRRGKATDVDDDDEKKAPFRGTTPLFTALVYRHYDSYRLLITAGADLGSPPSHDDVTSDDDVTSSSVLRGMARHGCGVEYARLLVACGGLLREAPSRVAELFAAGCHGNGGGGHRSVTSERCRAYLGHAAANPLTLQELARISLRKRLTTLHFLSIPHLLKTYVLFSRS